MDDDGKDDLFGWHTRARKDDPETSKQAAKKVMPKLNELQRKIHEFMKTQPKGLTEFEVEEHFGWHGSTYRTRVRELGDKGLLVNIGETYGKRRRIAKSRDPNAERDIWMCPEFVDSAWRVPSELPPTPPEPPRPTNAYYDKEGRLIHDRCAFEGCTNSPGFVVGCSLLKDHLGTWYCQEHHPDERIRRTAPADR